MKPKYVLIGLIVLAYACGGFAEVFHHTKYVWFVVIGLATIVYFSVNYLEKKIDDNRS